MKTHSLQQQEDTDSTRSVRGEVSTKTTFQRSAKVGNHLEIDEQTTNKFQGNVTIAECDPNGKFITLENTHRTKVSYFRSPYSIPSSRLGREPWRAQIEEEARWKPP